MQKVKVKDICKIYNGYSFKSDNYVESGIRIIRIANVQKGFIEDSAPVFYPENTDGIEKYLLNEGDLLLSLTGNVGRVALLEKKMLPAALNQRVACLRLKNDIVDKEFLFHFFNSSLFENQCIQNANGVAQKNLSTRWLYEYEIPLYPKGEQHRIVEVLNRIRTIILYKNTELNKLDNLIKSRFVEMFDDCSEIKAIGEVVSICRGASPRPIQKYITNDDNGINWIKIGDVSDDSLYITETVERITKEGAEKSREVNKGDFILSNSMSYGRPYILRINGCVHDGWLILSDFSQSFNELYLYYALRSEYVQHQFEEKVDGAVVKNLNSNLVKETLIKIPSMNEQNQFSLFAKQIDKLKVEVQKSLDKTQMLFDSLMQEYFG